MASSPENQEEPINEPAAGGFDSAGGLSQEALDILMASSGIEGLTDSLEPASAAELREQSGADAAVSYDSEGGLNQDALDALMASAGIEVTSSAAQGAPASSGFAASGSVSAAVIDLPSFGASFEETSIGSVMHAAEPSGMSRVRDIPLDVTVELGRTRLLIRDILDLNAGSIIELDKIAGEPVDLFANSMLVARGEVIVIDDNFGVRITEIITAGDRAQTKEANALAA